MFLQTSPKKGRMLDIGKLAVEMLKEARMRNRSNDNLQKNHGLGYVYPTVIHIAQPSQNAFG